MDRGGLVPAPALVSVAVLLVKPRVGLVVKPRAQVHEQRDRSDREDRQVVDEPARDCLLDQFQGVVDLFLGGDPVGGAARVTRDVAEEVSLPSTVREAEVAVGQERVGRLPLRGEGGGPPHETAHPDRRGPAQPAAGGGHPDTVLVRLLEGAESLGREVRGVILIVDQTVAGVAEQEEVLLRFPIRKVLGEPAGRAGSGSGADVVRQFPDQDGVEEVAVFEQAGGAHDAAPGGSRPDSESHRGLNVPPLDGGVPDLVQRHRSEATGTI